MAALRGDISFRYLKQFFLVCPGLPQILVSYCNVYSLYQFIFCPGLPQILVSYCNVYSLFQFLPLGHCCICWQVNVYWTDNMLSDMTICFLLMLMCFCYGNHKLINEVQVNEHCGRWQFVSRSILYEERDLLNLYRIWSLSFSFFIFLLLINLSNHGTTPVCSNVKNLLQ